MLESLLHGGRLVDLSMSELNAPVVNWQEFDQLFGIDSSILSDREIETHRPDFFNQLSAEFPGSLILRKIHDRCWRTCEGRLVFPPGLSRGAVYIVRDPRDVAVSAAHYYGISLDESIRRLNDSTTTLAQQTERRSSQLPQPLGSWSDHVTSWLDDSEMPVHLVRYEDLLEDAGKCLRVIASFLGMSSEGVENAVAATDFARLQEQEAAVGFSPKLSTCAKFFRSGRKEQWKAVLSPAQVSRVDGDHRQVMTRLGYL
jgi:aryl sulfotransferase